VPPQTARRSERIFGAVISAPIVEESAKAFILFVLFFWKKDEFDGIVDGIVYAGMVGLGFAMTENILYYGRAVWRRRISHLHFHPARNGRAIFASAFHQHDGHWPGLVAPIE